MIAMKFTIELDIGLSFPLQAALPQLVTDRETKTHRRGRSKRSYGHCRRRTEIPEADGSSVSFGTAPHYGAINVGRPVLGVVRIFDGTPKYVIEPTGSLDWNGPPPLAPVKSNTPLVGFAATARGNGFWVVGSDGGAFALGDAGFSGSTGGLHLNKPVVGMAPTPSGRFKIGEFFGVALRPSAGAGSSSPARPTPLHDRGRRCQHSTSESERGIGHRTDQKIRVHAVYSVAALMLVNLACREADRAGIHCLPTSSWRAWRRSGRSP